MISTYVKSLKALLYPYHADIDTRPLAMWSLFGRQFSHRRSLTSFYCGYG